MTRARKVVLAVVVIVVVAAVGLTAAVVARDDVPPARGELIAYSCKQAGTAWYAICVVHTDGTGMQRLTSRLPATDPAWSPDGREIAFTRREDVGEYTQFSEDDVFVMHSTGGGARRLSEERDGVHTGQPAWSPDGDEIVFVRGTAVPSTLPARPGELFVMHADGSEVRSLTRGSRDLDPAWSPDGREIVFARAVKPPFSGLWVVAATGGPPHRLTGAPGRVDGSAAWSPDSTRIAFTRTRFETEATGVASVLVMRRDGTGLHELVRNHYFACCTSGLSWSPDGRTIAFETSPSRTCTGIALVDVATRRVRPLTHCTGPRESALSPSWQPDTTAREH
jgi:Tol biopolymer transport system component